MTEIRVRSLSEEDWATYRTNRLAALAESPEAFVAQLADEQAYDEQLWRLRMRRAQRMLAEVEDEALREQGVGDYDADTCWHDYRLGMIQVPLISALGCAFSIETERGDDMMAAMLRRGCQAIRDLGTLDLIDAE